MSKPRLIAFYLPQFYPTPENDEWWEPGFTEWTNVVRAKPLFKGHYQPRIPGALGYYDLRNVEVREQQAELARKAGIEGFCYWHYWFAGRRLLDKVFSEVVISGKPDYPFCLCWANHSWYKKTWDSTKPDKLLIEQTYPGEQDFINHFYAMLPAFKDKRYMKKDGKLIFGVFEPGIFSSFPQMKTIWNILAIQNGLDGFYFFALAKGLRNIETIKEMSYDAIVYDHLPTLFLGNRLTYIQRAALMVFHKPRVLDYNYYVQNTVNYIKRHPEYTPCIIPNFDHSPRSSYKGVILHNNSPLQWEILCREVSSILKKREDEQLLFIKSWNEWGEGNYLEPDEKFGMEYIEATQKGILGK